MNRGSRTQASSCGSQVEEDADESCAEKAPEEEAEAGAPTDADTTSNEDKEEQSEKCVAHSCVACSWSSLNITAMSISHCCWRHVAFAKKRSAPLLPAVAQLEKCLALFEKQAEEGRLDAHTREILCQIALKVRHPPCKPKLFTSDPR